MRCMLIFAIAAVSLACAAPPKSQNEILAHFFGYAETIRGIQIHNMMSLTLKFVQQVVDSVPIEQRGPGTATLQAYANKGKSLRQRGTTGEKYNYIFELQQVFEGLNSKLSQSAPESQVIGMSLLGLLAVSSEFANENEKLHNKFVEGATQMKAKLSPSTIVRESELFEAIDKYIASTDIQQHEALFEKIMSFKDRY
ncbi:uncharacterized protein LOC6732871 [Drosophila simulans]|uniref:GD21731 n=1 Tax=Drosophila simulans TaxID=7240 RepID=B4QAE6_DROSI|nr:uncharacterized protein LOC6732871 [Drosophila simulans]EDX05563.1 GD21731 [Drosophila simulans]KMY91099.1 uncharacterized protein Dsimw501_GD21731 [Drosophila simulans]